MGCYRQEQGAGEAGQIRRVNWQNGRFYNNHGLNSPGSGAHQRPLEASGNRFSGMSMLVRFWILLCSVLVASGWTLSAVHALNRAGYGVVLAGFVVFSIWWWRRQGVGAGDWQRGLGKLARRFRKRRAAGLFLVLAVMAFLAGALYLPENSDTNDYRTPRVWHWLATGQWHWIHTLDVRLNIAGTGFEWLTAPLMLFTGTDRFIFIFNWISYLFLPGLIYGVFTQLGVSRRVAWWWMWLLPSGWCFVMQASSVVNDSFAAVFVLAAVDLALRARRSGRVEEVWLALLSLALMTGAKQTNLPLLLPGGLVLLPVAKLLGRRLAGTAGVLVLAAVVSVVPLTVLNLMHTGNWMGMNPAAQQTVVKMNWAVCALDSPVWGLVGNVFCLPLQNLAPPVMPADAKWNALMEHFVQTKWGAHFQSFESFGHIDKSAIEANAGLGPLLFLFAILTAVLAVRGCRPGAMDDRWERRWWLALRLAPWLALAVFMAKVGTAQIGRHAAVYYILLFPLVLAWPANGRLVRRGWWRGLGLLAMGFTSLVLVVSRERPLFPVNTILGYWGDRHPQWKAVASARATYGVRLSVEAKKRWARDCFPPGEPAVGYAVLRGPMEESMWVPFGSRRVYRILPGDSPGQFQAAGVRYVITDDDGLKKMDLTVADWMRAMHATLAGSENFLMRPGVTNRAYLLRLDATGEPGAKPAAAADALE